MNALIRELARQAGMTRLRNDGYAGFQDAQLEQLVESIVDQCVEAAASIAECQKYQDLIREQLQQKFDLQSD
jgi:hypothetical protein